MVTTPVVYKCLENTEWLQLRGIFVPTEYRMVTTQNTYNYSAIFVSGD
jgi:hypothetical protein